MKLSALIFLFLLNYAADAADLKDCSQVAESLSQIGKSQMSDSVSEALLKNWEKGPLDLASEVRSWTKALDHPIPPLTRALLERAEILNIKIKIGPISGAGNAHYDAASNTVKIDAEKLIALFQGAGVPLGPARLIDELITHELIHGTIASRFPNFNYQSGTSIPRPFFEQPLKDILARLPAPPPGTRVEKILRIIETADPGNQCEEVITYSLTDADFGNFMKQAGEMHPLLKHLKSFGFSELIP